MGLVRLGEMLRYREFNPVLFYRTYEMRLLIDMSLWEVMIPLVINPGPLLGFSPRNCRWLLAGK